MRAWDLEDEGFAGELSAVRAAHLPSHAAARMRAAIATGAKAGLMPSLLVFAGYFLLNPDAPMPWLELGSIIALYGPGVGILLAGFVEALVLLGDRVARLGFGLRAIANPVTAGALGGMLAGTAPGAIGVVVFGAYHGPFVGSGLIAAGLILGSVMIAIPLAIRARRARGASDGVRAVVAATAIATATLCAVAAVVAPIIVGGAFDEVRGAVDDHGGLVGAVAGAMAGGIVGVFIGIVIALGRSLRARR